MPSFQEFRVLPVAANAPCVTGLSAQCPYAAFTDSTGEPIGDYWFDLGGTPVQLFADGTGHVLLRSATGIGTQPVISPPSIVRRGDNAQYDQPTIEAAAAMATRISLGAPGYSELVWTERNNELNRLRNYQSLNRNRANWSAGAWDGARSRMTHTCRPGTISEPFNVSVYHACGNTAGLHWMSNSMSRWSYADGNSTIELWVR